MAEEDRITTNLGIVMPFDFPIKPYNEVHQYLIKYHISKKVECTLLRIAWNGLGYRYRAMASHDEQFTTSVNKSNSPPPEERYIQENALFGFFINAVSGMECLFFSIYCMASLLDTNSFPVMESKELKFYPHNVKELFIKNYPNEGLSGLMKSFLDNIKWKELNDFRTVLFHRGIPPRSFYKGGERDGTATMPINPKESSHMWQYDFPIDEMTTSLYRHWLSTELINLLNCVEGFCKSKL